MMPANYNANYQIVQSPGIVVVLSEQIHDARVIPSGGQPYACHEGNYGLAGSLSGARTEEKAAAHR
jgi:hypothetical protein